MVHWDCSKSWVVVVVVVALVDTFDIVPCTVLVHIVVVVAVDVVVVAVTAEVGAFEHRCHCCCWTLEVGKMWVVVSFMIVMFVQGCKGVVVLPTFVVICWLVCCVCRVQAKKQDCFEYQSGK